ncbi:MAG: fructose-like system or or component [Thermoanaerobacteraceae bacterium]|jgi:fructose-specific PTS system IIC-like component|nr:fructose-like system or or component [Thermoanaerobacteraceae bacterium]MDN5303001.1 fructose-like system or or component [Thermoanaerobacteraceae bacterium]MDN5312961.1 fructose-like system or or component [Thermoanaerobacteraceae bacterium]
MGELVDLLKKTRQHLMTGVSYMIPFVVAGGILIALSVAISGKPSVPESGFLKDTFNIGVGGFSLMVPILAGYIAFSMADRPGIAPGAIGGYLANQIGAGFLGGLIAGLVAGIVVFYLKKIQVPKNLKPVMPIFVFPIFGTLIVGGLMVWVIGAPIAGIMAGLTEWLKGLGLGNKVLLGLILGAMIAFDMGGPVNKVAYTFAVGLIKEGIITVMGPVGVAICTPPLGMAVATWLAPKKYTIEERENGKAALIMGLIGITEGAIPFAAMDPIKVIPSLMVGSAAGAITAMLLNVGNNAPWGGWIVLPVVKNIPGYIISTLVGIAITAFMVNALKKPIEQKNEDEELKIEGLDF